MVLTASKFEAQPSFGAHNCRVSEDDVTVIHMLIQASVAEHLVPVFPTIFRLPKPHKRPRMAVFKASHTERASGI